MIGKAGKSQVNVDLIRYQAERIRRIAEDMRRLSSGKLSDSAYNIAAVWRGDAATRFLNHCEKTRSEIDKVAGDLFEIADFMEQEAKILGR